MASTQRARSTMGSISCVPHVPDVTRRTVSLFLVTPTALTLRCMQMHGWNSEHRQSARPPTRGTHGGVGAPTLHVPGGLWKALLFGMRREHPSTTSWNACAVESERAGFFSYRVHLLAITAEAATAQSCCGTGRRPWYSHDVPDVTRAYPWLGGSAQRCTGFWHLAHSLYSALLRSVAAISCGL